MRISSIHLSDILVHAPESYAFGLNVWSEAVLQEIGDKIEEDIRLWVPKKEITSEDISEADLGNLKTFSQVLMKLSHTQKQRDLLRRTRILMSIIQRRNISDDGAYKINLQQTLVEIGKSVGITPVLNEMIGSTIALPSSAHLPVTFERNVMQWSKQAVTHPARDAKGVDKVIFFQREKARKTRISVRWHLLESESTFDDLKLEGKALCYAEADFYDETNLDADHLQPSTDIIARQLELLDAMNTDPVYGDEVYKRCEEPDGDTAALGYFLRDADGKYYATKKFILFYHNCIDNLWLISRAENVGSAKGISDPIDWLERHPHFGENFFRAIGGKDSIRTDSILYITQEGEILAFAAKKWFREHYKEAVQRIGILNVRIKEPEVSRALCEAGLKLTKSERLDSLLRISSMCFFASMPSHKDIASAAAAGSEHENVHESDTPDTDSLSSKDLRLTSENTQRASEDVRQVAGSVFLEGRLRKAIKKSAQKVERKRKRLDTGQGGHVSKREKTGSEDTNLFRRS